MRMFLLALAGLIGLATAGSVDAQGTDEAAGLLREKLRAGDRVTLSLNDTVVNGKLLAIESDALRVQTAAGESRVPFSEVNEARRKRRGILLGTIIGASAGVAWGVIGSILVEATGDEAALGVLGSVATGAGIGMGLDALLNLNRTVYRRDRRRSDISLAPSIGPRHARMHVVVRW